MSELLSATGEKGAVSVLDREVATSNLTRTAFEALALEAPDEIKLDRESADDYRATITRLGDGQTNVDD